MIIGKEEIKLETIEVSSCCKAEVREGYISGADHNNPVATCYCVACKSECFVEFMRVIDRTEDQVALDLAELKEKQDAELL